MFPGTIPTVQRDYFVSNFLTVVSYFDKIEIHFCQNFQIQQTDSTKSWSKNLINGKIIAPLEYIKETFPKNYIPLYVPSLKIV